ncbi:MAG: hypothetical protein H6739_05185 [Alphaproteobacteria bacterium]|nr:hypothetical protein [Alphaproteobacteria bacterium]
MPGDDPRPEDERRERRVDPRDDSPRSAEGRGPRIPGLRTARRLVGEPGFREAKEVLGAVLDSSDRVKTEAVRMIGREVRTYLEGLGLGDDLHDLLTNYSLEVHASFSLKPLADAEPERGRRKRRERPREPEPDAEQDPS